VTRSDERRAITYEARLRFKLWWQSPWNQIWTLTALYVTCLCVWLVAFPVVFDYLGR
jgi:hypothetical protein